MTTSIIIRLFEVGEATPSMLVQWAMSQLSQGEYTDHLAVVAGYPESITDKNGGDIYDDFVKAISELGRSLQLYPPSNQRGVQICETYLAKELSPDRALFLLYELWVDMTYHVKTESGATIDPFMLLSDTLTYMDEGDVVGPYQGICSANWISYFDREVSNFLTHQKNKSATR